MEKKRTAEQTFCTALIKWLRYNMKHPCYIEAKVSYDEKFNLKSGFKDHQLPTLINAQRKPFGYKISDIDQQTTKPFDILFSNKIKTYVAIQWVRRGNKRFYLINPVTISSLIEAGDKSIDEKMCAVIADVTGTLK